MLAVLLAWSINGLVIQLTSPLLPTPLTGRRDSFRIHKGSLSSVGNLHKAFCSRRPPVMIVAVW